MKYSEATKEQSDLSIAKIAEMEQRMIDGDPTVTMHILMSETHKLLSITKPVTKPVNCNKHQNLY